jgi:hypothetical protein
MNNWEKCIKALSYILENPFVEKGYEDLKKYYISNNLNQEAEVIDQLIKIKFKNANDTNNNK